MINVFLYFAVVVGGIAVLILEILGTRLLGPHFGVSLYLWSALIGVTLAALGTGYALGGMWADRRATFGRFSLLFGLAGLLVLMLPWAVGPVLRLLEPAGLRTAALAGAAILFFLPLMLLGMVSPFAIRLKATSLEVVGRTAGNLYAASTLAGVVAAVGTGFVLIPALGVRRLLVMVGVLLLGTAVLGWALERRSRVTRAAAILALPLLLGAAAALHGPGPDPGRGLLDVADSPYGEIRVLEKDGLRYLLIDGATHSAVDPATWVSEFPYVSVMDLAREFLSEPGRLLLVGLGAGSVAKSFAAAGWQVDAVEIDPVVTRFAHEHFGLQETEARVTHQDGRRFLLDQPEGTYDLIILDAFGSSSIPFHLVSREVFALIRSRLVIGGLLAMNVEAVGWHDPLVDAVAATLAAEFNDVQVLPLAEPPDQLGNVVLLAADFPLELPYELDRPDSRWSPQYHRVHAWDNRFGPPGPGHAVLTDNHNPVDLWSDKVNQAARRRLHGFFGQDSAAW